MARSASINDASTVAAAPHVAKADPVTTALGQAGTAVGQAAVVTGQAVGQAAVVTGQFVAKNPIPVLEVATGVVLTATGVAAPIGIGLVTTGTIGVATAVAHDISAEQAAAEKAAQQAAIAKATNKPIGLVPAGLKPFLPPPTPPATVTTPQAPGPVAGATARPAVRDWVAAFLGR